MCNNWFTIGRLTVHGYGVMIGLGVVAAILLAAWRAKRRGLSDDVVYGIALCLLIFGAIGAKLLYCLMHLPDVRENPALIIQPSGFLLYGGIVAGIIAMWLYCRHKHCSFLVYFDLTVPSVALAQAIGRIGCLLAGCCYGKPTQSHFALVFPEGSIAPSGVGLWPTQPVSCAGDLLIMAVLLLYARKKRTPGNVGLLYLLLYAAGRFAIEFFRNDYQAVVGPFSYAQIISAAVAILSGVLLLLRSRKQPPL